MENEPSTELAPPWGARSLPGGDETLTAEIGPATFWARSRAGEIWLAHASADWARPEAGPPRELPPEDEGWTRWPVPAGSEGIHLSPAFPPRPVVAKPELSFHLLPRSEARIYIRVPLWCRVEVATEAKAEDRQLLTERPTVTLSDTWWGELTDGELSYWLPTSARREVTPEIFSPHLAVCPLNLANRSEAELDVERIALRVAHLSLYRDERGFWADETTVRYRGEAEGSEIDVGRRAPDAARKATRVAEPRTPLTQSLRARTFTRLWTLSGLGGE